MGSNDAAVCLPMQREYCTRFESGSSRPPPTGKDGYPELLRVGSDAKVCVSKELYMFHSRVDAQQCTNRHNSHRQIATLLIVELRREWVKNCGSSYPLQL